MKRILSFIPLILIAGLIVLTYLSGLYRAVDFETIRYHHVELSEYVNNNPIMTPFMFIGYCAFTTFLLLPGALILSLLGGFLFPQPWSTLYLLIGTTIGALITFLTVRAALGSTLMEKKITWLTRIEAGFNKNAISYLLFFRLIPFFPFWLASIIPTFFNVRLRTYVWTTFLGSIPAALIFTNAGKGFNTVCESAAEFSAQTIFNTDVQILLGCLAIFALLPIIFKKRPAKKREWD